MTPGLVALSSCTIELHYWVALIFFFFFFKFLQRYIKGDPWSSCTINVALSSCTKKKNSLWKDTSRLTTGVFALSSCTIKLHYQVALLFFSFLFFNFWKDTSRVTPGLLALSSCTIKLHYWVALIFFFFSFSEKIHQVWPLVLLHYQCCTIKLHYQVALSSCTNFFYFFFLFFFF